MNFLIVIAAAASSVMAQGDARLAVLDEQLDSRTVWGAAEKKQAQELMKAHMDRWGICLAMERDRFRASRELPNDIATAVMGRCIDQEGLTRHAVVRAFYGYLPPVQRESMADDIMQKARGEAREGIVSFIVNLRLAPAPRSRRQDPAPARVPHPR
ncbi:hypothetical protein [Novosphingobium capsulatum]|uniref:hypothetical protein n=1 Tax=Novosphingobium capsulatum TaxID=13688 RepID=UPI002E14A052|nr:hypothetical protein U0041_03815 [Novosphingobium capsulatum]